MSVRLMSSPPPQYLTKGEVDGALSVQTPPLPHRWPLFHAYRRGNSVTPSGVGEWVVALLLRSLHVVIALLVKPKNRYQFPALLAQVIQAIGFAHPIHHLQVPSAPSVRDGDVVTPLRHPFSLATVA